ncbi:polysaccharide pyruvyl transferase family protein [Pseudaminobacter soli (ex Li et al. 2025)]|uniref:Polysaccharide pyruvyl transferase family protein n=1 Tax=Pseudaminobacter soli (ex Li et al. 2025) TaxID=1295366 RepID=A0A2P7S0V2_9HYPH|nr:polysaccharide pyruvyl transferase family protein [Mesorhizobium soli]PSJ56101.1 polysaccharide pyruvyl transferase family protein [Mesorhizobium soli]
MRPRILVTGIPGHYSRLANGADGFAVSYSERQKQPETKDEFLQELRNISNTGNYLIGEGALRALAPHAKQVPFWHLYNCSRNGDGFEQFNSNFDICVFTCANLLRKGLSADAEAEVLSKLKMPIVMLGIGQQNRKDLENALPEGTKQLLSVLKDREHYFLTRGLETAGFLKDQGFSNVRPTGCPSVYFMPDNMRRSLRKLPGVQIGKARTIFSGYLGANHDAIVDANALEPQDSVPQYVVQDEFLHFDMKVEPNAEGRVYDSASGKTIGDLAYPGTDRLKKPFDVRTFFDTNQWRAWASSMDFNFGRRFHGSIIAMQAAVPSLMVAVDDRMREMLGFTGLPAVDAADIDKAENRAEFVADHLAGLNASELVDRYSDRERNFRSALREIGIGQ